LDSALRANLRLSNVRTRGATVFVAPVRRREHTLSMFALSPPHPGDIVAAINPIYPPFNCKQSFDRCQLTGYSRIMIRSFRHKGLKELYESGRSAKVRADLRERCLRRLDALNAAKDVSKLNVPGFDFHGLEGKPKRYSIHVNGPFCITFEWIEGDAWRVDFENYH